LLRREHLPKKLLLPRISPGPPRRNVGVDDAGEWRVLSCCLVRPHRDGAVDSGDGDEVGEGSYDRETCMMSHQRGPKVCVRSFAGQGWCPASGSPNGHIQGPKADENGLVELNQAQGPAPLEFGTAPASWYPGNNTSHLMETIRRFAVFFWAPPCSPDSR